MRFKKTDSNGNVQIDLMAIIHVVYKRKYLVLLLWISATVAALYVALTATRYYQVTTKMVYQSSSQATGSLGALAALAGISAPASSSDASLYLQDILFSHDILSKVLDSSWHVSLISKDTATTIKLVDVWELKNDSAKYNWKALQRDKMLKLLRGGYVQFGQDKKTAVISLTTEFEDPRLAYDINLFLFKELNSALVNKMSYKARANREFIEKRLSEVKSDLSNAENQLRNYRERNRLRIDPGDILEDSRLQRNVLINQEVMIQLQKQFEMAKIEELKDMPVLDIIDTPQRPVYKSRPKGSIILIKGSLIGLIVACIIAILVEYIYEFMALRTTRQKKQMH